MMEEGGEERERAERGSGEGRNGGEGTERGSLSHFLTSGCTG